MIERCSLHAAAGWLLLLSLVPASSVAAPQKTRTVIDNLGRSITVPARIERVLSLQPEITRIIVALGAADRLAGIDHFLRTNDPLFKIIAPGQDRLPLVSMADYNVNMEMVLRLAPEAIFGAPEDRTVVEALQSKTGIPTIALSSQGRFDRLIAEIGLLGSVLDRSERAAELIAFFQAGIEAVRTRIREAVPQPKPRVYLAFWGSPTRTPVHYEPVDAAGAVNVAENLLPSFLGTLIANVNLETIIAWDPDVILVHGNYPIHQRAVTTASFLSDGRLASLKAVGAGRVHYTFGFWNWWDPAEVLFETEYLARLFHPGLFPGFDLESRGNAIFKKFYGVERAFSILSATIGCGAWLDAR